MCAGTERHGTKSIQLVRRNSCTLAEPMGRLPFMKSADSGRAGHPREQSATRAAPRMRIPDFARGFAVFVLVGFFNWPANAADFRFCVYGDKGSANVRVLGHAIDKSGARMQAELKLCEITCGRVCAALEFDAERCGGQREVTIDLSHAQGHVFCEHPDGPSPPDRRVTITLRSLVATDYQGSASKIPDILAAANGFLAAGKCPLRFELEGSPKTLPGAFNGLRIGDQSTLRAVAQYPGTVKFVNDIGYCAKLPATVTLNTTGEEIIKECTWTDYFTTIIAEQDRDKAAILLLRGFGHLADVQEDRTDELLYTLSDPDLLIPFSPLLIGQTDKFHITKYQCVQLVKYAIDFKNMNSIERNRR
jgi:hypothetical protein